MKTLKIKKAFTLIELIFVIVIFAIISMFGADLYTRIYDSYVQTRAMNQLEGRTANVLNIISSRLEDRVRGAVIGRRSDTNAYVPILLVQTQHDILEWLGQSIESKNLTRTAAGGPESSIGWSGFADLRSIDVYGFNNPTPAAGASFLFNSQGSNINRAVQVINQIKGNNNFGIIFKNIHADPMLQRAFGFNNANANKIATAGAGPANNVISVNSYIGEPNLAGNLVVELSEQYYLVHSAYAIVPTNVNVHPQGGQIFDLELRYNYETWNGQAYDDAATQRAIIARDVSMFRFKDDNGAIAMKLCMRDNGRNLDPNRLDLIVCKSQVVY